MLQKDQALNTKFNHNLKCLKMSCQSMLLIT